MMCGKGRPSQNITPAITQIAAWPGEREVSGGLGCHVEEGMAVSFVPSYWVESSLLDELRWVSLQ